MDQVAALVPLVAGGAVQAVHALAEPVMAVVLVAGDLAVVADGTPAAVADRVVDIVDGRAKHRRRGLCHLLLQQLAGRIVLVAHRALYRGCGAAHAQHAFGHLGALACGIERVDKAGDVCTIGLFVQHGGQLVGGVVLVVAGAAVGSRHLHPVAGVVVGKTGGAAVGVGQGVQLVERVVAGLDGLARGADLGAVAVAIPGVVHGGVKAGAQAAVGPGLAGGAAIAIQGQAQAAIGGVSLAVHASIAVIALGQAAAIAARDFDELAAHVIAVDGLAAVKVGTTHQAAFADKQFI